MSESKISVDEFNHLAVTALPLVETMNIRLEKIGFEFALFRAYCDKNALRPGDTIAGPVMMALADVAFYAAVLSVIGLVELAVTTNLSINFLRKPGPGDIYCRARILKMGKRLAVCEAVIYNDLNGQDKPIAHATGTYSIPPH